MAAVSNQCRALVPYTLPPVADEAASSSSSSDSEACTAMVSLEAVCPKELHTRLPGQTSMPPELVAKLERQDSDDSVVSAEEGIQADAAPETSDSPGSGGELEPRSQRSSSVVSDGSEEGGRDSGIEAEREPDMVVPEEEVLERIVAQVEFYFSDANVAKDKFLLKHIRRNKEGYVSLKLVSSFKKVKQLTKDWRVVSHSLQKQSTKIQINDLGTKIRRTEPLPDLDEAPITCAVLALALPLSKPSIQSVSELFSECGDIAFIRVVRAGSAIPQDLKGLAAKHAALSETHCAWIEFETPENAKAATDMSTEDGLKVVPILPEAQKKPEKTQQQKGSQPSSRKSSATSNSGYGSPLHKGPPSRKNSFIGSKSRKDSGLGSDVSDLPPLQPRYPRRKCLSLPQTQCPNLKELSAVVEARKNRPKSKSCTEFQLSSLPPPTSWVQRNLLAAAAASAASAASPIVGSRPPYNRIHRISHGSLPVPEQVLRFPKGPDGSKGFSPAARRRTLSTEETTKPTIPKTDTATLASTTKPPTAATPSSPNTTTHHHQQQQY
ncbi:La-related protein 6 [Chionoecetes opilio]|uniref:La-related protein 6 n=1 Tax=Chionoecetes opilio TaxID=41210 RepID=A0A8J4YQM4_CHIOP|nr:La-related protein 6 [Chionoecetes opilio]